MSYDLEGSLELLRNAQSRNASRTIENAGEC